MGLVSHVRESLLPTGKVLAWGKYESGTTSASKPRLWIPGSGPPNVTAVAIAEPDMLGANAVIAKPFDVDVLLAKLDDLLTS